MVQWNFGESCHIHHMKIYHHKVGEVVPAVNYKIYDEIFYQLEMYIWDIPGQKWVPYAANDVVLEFKMLHPYYRKQLTHYISE